MATVILVRHGRSTANATGVLAGRLTGVKLDAAGQAQAERAGVRLRGVPLSAIVTSPLERCRQTARAISQAQPQTPATIKERGITECDYGEWQARELKDLAKEKLWATVQNLPPPATLPAGESLAAMQVVSQASSDRLAAVEADLRTARFVP